MDDKVDQDLEDALRKMKYLMCQSSPSEMLTNSRLQRVNHKIQFSSNNRPHQKEGSKLVLPGKTKCNSLRIPTTINFALSNRWLSVCKLQIKILTLSFTSQEEQFPISSLNHSRDKSLKLVCEEPSKWRKRDREWLKMQLGLKKLKPPWSRMLGRGEWSNKKSCSKTSKRVIWEMFWDIRKFKVSLLKKEECWWVRVLENKDLMLWILLPMLIILGMTM